MNTETNTVTDSQALVRVFRINSAVLTLRPVEVMATFPVANTTLQASVLTGAARHVGSHSFST